MGIVCKIDSLLENRTRVFLFLFIISIIIQVIFLIVLGGSLQDAVQYDYLQYYKPGAESLIGGYGYSRAEDGLIVRYPPGFSIFLTVPLFFSDITGISESSAIIIYFVLTCAVTSVIFFLMTELIAGRRIAFLSSLAWITYPFHLWLIKAPNSEIPFFLFFFGALYAFFKGIKKEQKSIFFCAGILFGIATIIRPIGLLLALISGIFAIIIMNSALKNKIIFALLVFGGMAAAILPWEITVLNKTGEIIPVSKNGPLSIVDGLTFALDIGPRADQAHVSDDVLHLMRKIRNNETKLTGMFTIVRYMADEFSNEPLPVIKLYLTKTARVWYGTNAMWFENEILLIQIVYFVSILAGMVVAIRNSIIDARILLFILAIVFYFWGMAWLALSILRYMVPVMGLLLIFSGIFVDKILTLVFERKVS